MKQHFSIQHEVKVLPIYELGQKIHFTVRHPENAECLTGLAVTCTRMRQQGFEGSLQPDYAGTLALAIPEKGDVFYTETVKAEKPDFRDFAEKKINLPFTTYPFGFSGKRIEYFDTVIPATHALLEGYYEDSAVEGGLIIIGGDASLALYKLTLYLRYKMKP